MQIIKGKKKPFLAPLSLKKLPMVGAQTYQVLRSMGVEYVRSVQKTAMGMMNRVLGKNGVSLRIKAEAIDNNPVIPYHQRKPIPNERTYEHDTIDVLQPKSLKTPKAEN